MISKGFKKIDIVFKKLAFIIFELPENFSKIKIAPSGDLFEKGTPKRFEFETFVLALADRLAAAG